MATLEKTELEILYEISRIANSPLNLKERLDSIVEITSEKMRKDSCSIVLLDKEGTGLVLKATKGLNPEAIDRVRVDIGEGIVGWVAKEGVPVAVERAFEDPRFKYIPMTGEERFKSMLAVPIMADEKVIGVLMVQTVEPWKYGVDEITLLSTISNGIGGIIRNATLYERTKALAEENERRLLGLSVLYDISSAMKTTLELERLLRIVLAGVTIGGGLGFNRAMLFLVDEWSNILQGMLGVGPDSAEEAGIIWNRLGTIENITKWITTEEELTEPKKSRLDEMVKNIRVPILQETCILTRTVMEKRPYNIANAADDARVCKTCKKLFGSSNFATAPLIAKDKVVGIIVVDNIFNRKPITEEDMNFLSMLASQAGMAIENAMIYTRLEETNRELREAQDRLIQSEKMAALGEMMSRLAHEIRNPLVAVSGFARRLRVKTSEDQVQNRYASIILQETERLEKFLEETLTFSREAVPSFERSDINRIIEETLDLFKEDLAMHNIMVVTELGDIPFIFVDPQQMKRVFINLFSNAADAMRDGGELYVSTEMRKEETRPEIVIKVQDTGGGIPLDVLSNIFNPFFTTKAAGTGLGLSIVHRIIENHRGKIEVENKIGEGVTFSITLPIEELSLGRGKGSKEAKGGGGQ